MLMCAYHRAGCKRNVHNRETLRVKKSHRAGKSEKRIFSLKYDIKQKVWKNITEYGRETVTQPPGTAAMLSTGLSRSCVRLPPIWPRPGRAVPVTWFCLHLLWLETLTRPIWLAGRAMPGDRAALRMKPSPVTHPSVCDPEQMLVNLRAGSVAFDKTHTFTPTNQPSQGEKTFSAQMSEADPDTGDDHVPEMKPLLH